MLLQRFRNTSGRTGLAVRYICLSVLVESCGDNVAIYPGAWLLAPTGMTFGHNVSIHPMCYLDGSGRVEVGNNVSIAHGATIMSTTHSFDGDAFIRDQPVESRPTVIEDDVWIGAKATVVAGVRIGSGSVIGAGAVITKDVAPGSVAVGVPARVIRSRH